MFSEISKDLQKETIENICTKYNISFKELVEYSFRNNLPTDRDRGLDNYIYKKGDSFVITKTVKGHFEYYGIYDSLEDARKVKKELINCNWDKSQLPLILEKLGVKNNGNSE